MTRRDGTEMIVHADVDAFFVAVERLRGPSARDALVVAEEVVACANYEARDLGVRAGMSLARVRRRWPEVRVAPLRHDVDIQCCSDTPR